MRTLKAALVTLGFVAGGLGSGGALSFLGSVNTASAMTIRSCVPMQIKVTLGTSQGTAGTIYYPIVFTNTGAACAIWGVPAIQPVVGTGHRSVGPFAHSLSMGMMPARQILATHRSVSVAFGVVDTGNYSPSICGAKPADGVNVLLGSFITKTYVHLPIKVCTKRTSTTTKLLVPGVNGY